MKSVIRHGPDTFTGLPETLDCLSCSGKPDVNILVLDPEFCGKVFNRDTLRASRLQFCKDGIFKSPPRLPLPADFAGFDALGAGTAAFGAEVCATGTTLTAFALPLPFLTIVTGSGEDLEPAACWISRSIVAISA